MADRMPLRRGGCGLAILFLPAMPACAADQPVPAPAAKPDPREIVVYGRALAQIGVATSGSQGVVGFRDFEDRPLSRVGELVENVPGVIATQHSGTGKANQYFLRGFNLDHGTDFAGFVDGVPVNMPTHGHGQGYLDLNFIIPELITRIDYRKGPYFADVGDFSAAGTAQFSTADRLEAPLAQVTVGSYGYYRALAAGSTDLGDASLLAAFDGTSSNGPWVLDERLRKLNGLLKMSGGSGVDHWSVGLTGYHARWNATDQVPKRAIDAGLIGRFGNIDGALGGKTTRIGLNGSARLGDTSLSLYGVYYRFRLTSNFTYFLDDPVNGDEFQQRDRRGIFGGAVAHSFDTRLLGIPLAMTVGSTIRYDHIGKVGLYLASAGVRTGTVRQDRVDELDGALYTEAAASLSPRLRLVLGLRGDINAYRVHAETLSENGGGGHDTLVAPKVALAWRPIDHVELYANFGDSFHSNDVRGAAIRVDPKTGDPAERVPALVRARGEEVGARLESSRLTASLVVFHLTLGSELVFSGDGGTTEPNPASHRYGTELSLFWRPLKGVTLDGVAALTHARFSGVARGENRIPNSIDTVLSGGAEFDVGRGFAGSVRVRHFGAAPLVENDGARSRPTTLVNVGGYRTFGRIRLAVDVLNVLGSRDNDITYFYASRLAGEPAGGVDDYHLHPVEPRQVRVSLRYTW